MRLTTRWRLLRARTVPATALLVTFVAGAVVAVPPTLWLAMGRRAPARTEVVSKDGPRPFTPALRQSLHELGRGATPSGAGTEGSRRVEAFLAAQGGAPAQGIPEQCAEAETRTALERQLAVQETATGARLSTDPFATRAFQTLRDDAQAALGCLDRMLAAAPATEPARVEWIRLAGKLSGAPGAADRGRGLLAREALRSVDATSVAAPAPIYALHGYLDAEPDLAVAGETVRQTLRAQPDPTVRAALREVVSKRFSGLVTRWFVM